MYDSMNLSETLGDMYDIGIQDDTLSTLWEANTNLEMCVQTPYGPTDPQTIKSVTCGLHLKLLYKLTHLVVNY